MRKVVLIIFLIGGVLSCTPIRDASDKSHLKIDGSSTVYPITELALSSYAKKYPDKASQIELNVSGTGGGFQELCTGKIDIANASRKISPSEQQYCQQNNITCLEIPVALDGIAIIHEKLYQNDTLTNINFQDYIEELADIIACSYNMMDSNITLHVETEKIPITIDQSIPCGLILNEVLSNAYEHAFSEQPTGNICVSLSEQNHEVTMIIQDDGKGLPGELEEKQAERLGLSLVKTLTRQLGGSLKIENRGGAYFEINFIRDTKPNSHLS